MIVITGPGRSGTSFLAALYRELGFDLRGQWIAKSNAGLEAAPFIRANLQLADALGVVCLPKLGPRFLSRINSGVDRRLPSAVREPVLALLDSLRYRRTRLDLADSADVDAVVREFGGTLRSLAEGTEVVKDPRFCWTLAAWLASEASISAVVVALRPIDAMVESRVRAGMLRPKARRWAASNFTYGIGLVMAATTEYRVPTVVLRFPDFLDDPHGLHERLPLPEPRSWAQFEAAFTAVHDASLVHDHR